MMSQCDYFTTLYRAKVTLSFCSLEIDAPRNHAQPLTDGTTCSTPMLLPCSSSPLFAASSDATSSSTNAAVKVYAFDGQQLAVSGTLVASLAGVVHADSDSSSRSDITLTDYRTSKHAQGVAGASRVTP